MSDTMYLHIKDGGWGIPPYDPNFTVTGGNQQAVLSWNLSDLVVDGKKLCTVAGIVIRRGTTGYPSNENDGTPVVDSTDLQGTYTDTGLTNGTTYYYRAFPYSDHNVYGRDTYHAKGSATPSEAATLTVHADASVLEGETITATDGTHTVTATMTSGTAVFQIQHTGTWTVEGIPVEINQLGQSYSARIVVFAVHYSETDSNPDSADYPAGYDNTGWTPFAMDLSSGVPSYGAWDPEGTNTDKVKFLFPRSCMVKYNGERDYYLKEDDESKKADGTTSDYNNTSYGGNCMMEWGQDGKKIYWKIVADAGSNGWTFIVSNASVLNMKPWNHYDVNGDVADHWYTAKYFGSSDGTRMRSISGQSNYVNNTGTAEISLAEANNQTSDKLWTTEVFCDYMLIGMLCVLLSRSTNTQAKFGAGRSASGNSAAIGQGTMNGKGLFFGKSNGTDGVKIFGMENFFGNLWRRVRGLININGTYRIKMTYDQTDGSSVDGYNTDGSGYINAGAIGTTAAWVYPKHNIVRENCILAHTQGGSETTYIPDGTYLAASGTFYAVVGGYWGTAGLDGAFCVDLSYAVSATGASIGAALSLKPLAAA